jgi:hypothetical protein
MPKRRHPLVVLLIAGALALLAALPGMSAAAVQPGPPPTGPVSGTEDDVAQGYHRLLLEHTHWVESTWDEAAGHYKLADFDFASVLGNAVVLRFGDYDEQLAGVSRATLADHTLRTIAHFAATDRFVAPRGEWGGLIYFDSTFESYFVAAAHVMWDDLDATTRANVDTITRASADYVASLGAGEDPRSPGWFTLGLLGGFRSDTKLEEMGARTMPLATALAYMPNDANAPSWREWLDRWSASTAGLPAADQANPALIDGVPVAQWTRAHNIFDTFAVENHGSFAPHYQEAVDAYPGRDAAQFAVGRSPLPQTLAQPPNAAELSRTLRQVGTDSGVGAFAMVADRYHLYGRDILPLAYQSVVLRSPDAARAERMLLDHMGPYLHEAPEFRLTKFSGEPKYEPEARAELAMAYLLHRDARFGGGGQAVSEQEYFERASSVVDYGSDIGLVAQQSPNALAMASTKAGFVKFAFLPEHDDWLFDPSGGNPSLLPSTTLSVTGRAVHVYRSARDGFDASATLLRTPGGFAGYATLPTGGVVYATSGLGFGEGALRLFNLDMPGVRGLDGDRTYTAADGSATLAGGASGDGGVDELTFAPTQARFVRFLGVRPATQFGYSLWDFEVHDGTGPDLALGKPTTATSIFGAGFEPFRATDGNPATRWAVASTQRGRPDSSLQVDLGAAQQVSRVRLRFETAFAAAYRIQVSGDGVSWRDVASVPEGRTFDSDWLNVEDRVGFVVRDSTNPIRVDGQNVALSDGPASGAAGMVVEGHPRQSAAETAASARLAAPSGGPPPLAASVADGYLSLFNLGADAIADVPLTLPRGGEELRLYRGTQRTSEDGSVYDVSLAGADARVEAPRFTLAPRHDGDELGALRVTVADSRTVTIENVGQHGPAQLTLRAFEGAARSQVTVPAGHAKTVVMGDVPLTPVADLARTQIAFPTSPLPAGMSDPELALDGDAATSWRPGSGDGRMVVDVGASRALGAATLRWTGGRIPAFDVAVSDDGAAYRTVAESRGRSGVLELPAGTSGRYVALQVHGWRTQDAALADLGLFADADAAERTVDAAK